MLFHLHSYKCVMRRTYLGEHSITNYCDVIHKNKKWTEQSKSALENNLNKNTITSHHPCHIPYTIIPCALLLSSSPGVILVRFGFLSSLVGPRLAWHGPIYSYVYVSWGILLEGFIDRFPNKTYTHLLNSWNETLSPIKCIRIRKERSRSRSHVTGQGQARPGPGLRYCYYYANLTLDSIFHLLTFYRQSQEDKEERRREKGKGRQRRSPSPGPIQSVQVRTRRKNKQ